MDWILFMYVCMYICMCASLAPGRLDGFYSYSVFKSLFIIGQCPVNMNNPAPKTRDPSDGPQNTK
jgi:hypothetical protein